MSEVESAATINVGSADGDLRLCIATEVARQGELRLAMQLQNMQAAEGRATSVLGWAVAGLSALAVLSIDKAHRMLGLPPAFCLAVSASACMAALWPKPWNGPGYIAADLAPWGLQSELELKESLASGYESCAALNQAVLRDFGMRMRVGWIGLALAPTAAIIEIVAFGP